MRISDWSSDVCSSDLIRPAANQMLADMDHPFARGETLYDTTFENVQAGLRTDYLFRLANRPQGLVVGTGDLSEPALGWLPYGVRRPVTSFGVHTAVAQQSLSYLSPLVLKTEPQ